MFLRNRRKTGRAVYESHRFLLPRNLKMVVSYEINGIRSARYICYDYGNERKVLYICLFERIWDIIAKYNREWILRNVSENHSVHWSVSITLSSLCLLRSIIARATWVRCKTIVMKFILNWSTSNQANKASLIRSWWIALVQMRFSIPPLNTSSFFK